MSTKYLCVHCDKAFEHEGSKKPRCPECMRVNGLEPVVAPESSSARPPWLMWAIGAGALVAAGAGYTLWADEAPDTVSGEAPIAPLDSAALLGHLRNRHADARELAALVLPSESVESWAEQAAGSDGAQAKATALTAAIRARAAQGAFEAWSFGVPRETPITNAERTLEMIGDDDAHHHLYPLEVASLLAAGLRAVDVPAMVAEVIRYEGERSPPDGSGQLGYYVVAVYDDDAGEGDPTYYDPYLGRETQPEDARVLSDVEAVGAALSIRALYLLSRESDPERAMEASSAALRLDGSSPSIRAVRGAILVASGQANEGLDELSAAKQLRPDAPRRNLLAGVHLAQGHLDDASREIAAALEEYPEFAQGRATLAAIHLSRGEHDQARTELEEAERIDPQLHLLPQLWAGYYAMTGDMARAVELAAQSVERSGDIQTRLMAARIYRQASRYGMMRREAHAVLDNMPASRQAEMRAVILRMLGPTALEPVDEDLDEDSDEGVDEDDLDEDVDEGGLGLGDPDSLSLGSPALGGGGGPSLLGGDRLGGGGLQLGGGGGPSLGGGGGLQLGGGGGPSLGGGGLQLDMDE